MAASGSGQLARLVPANVLKLEDVYDVTLDGTGVNTSFIVTLSEPFRNTPKTLVVPQLGDTRVWTATYSAGTQSLTLSSTATAAAAYASATVPVILYAVDQP